jgi:hypothetical protein
MKPAEYFSRRDFLVVLRQDEGTSTDASSRILMMRPPRENFLLEKIPVKSDSAQRKFFRSGSAQYIFFPARKNFRSGSRRSSDKMTGLPHRIEI